jgi:DNA-binding response OmpR family regulator
MSAAPDDLHRGAYVVIADEDPKLLDMMVQTLRSRDCCVFKAYDGLAALELTLGLRVVDLLITNTRMPGLNGPQLIRHVREEMPALPILYVANKGYPEGAPDGLPADVPTLRDPFTPEQLLEAVRPLLEKRK